MKKKIKIKKNLRSLVCLEVEHYLCCCAESRAGESEQRPATSELEASSELEARLRRAASLTEASSELD